MRATIELYAVTVEHAKHAGPAGVSACFPDVVDGVASVVHADDGLVTVLAETPFNVRSDLAAAFQALLGSPHESGLGGKARDGVYHIVNPGFGKEFTAGVNPVVDAHKADPILPAEVQEDSELADAAKGIAEFAHHNHIAIAQSGEHPSPLGTILLLGTLLFYDAVTAERLHPRKVFVFGGEVFCEKKVSVFCHISSRSLPLNYKELLTRQMILGIILETVPA